MKAMQADEISPDSDAETHALLAGFSISAVWMLLGLLVPILNYLMLRFVTTHQVRETVPVALVRYTFLWGPWLVATVLSAILIQKFRRRTLTVTTTAMVLVSLIVVGIVELAVSLTPILSLLQSLS